MTVRLVWARGGEAHVVSLTIDAVTIVSAVPWPPGARVEGTLHAEGLSGSAGRPPMLRVKVHASRVRPEGDFLVAGRPIDLPRALRERIEALVAPSP